MSAESADNYQPSYRQVNVDETLKDHAARITTNERRWLMAKGALAALTAIKGVDFGIAAVGTLI